MIKQPLPLTAKSFFAHEHFVYKTNRNVLLIFTTEEEVIESYRQLLFFKHKSNAINIPPNYSNILYFPSFDTIPYDRISPNQNILSERANILSYLAINPARKLVVTNAVNLLSKLPPPEYLAESFLKLHCQMKLTAVQLAEFLVHNSFTRSASSIDSGEFSVRGEIVDIVLPGNKGYRINFSWDHIESIKEFDINSQMSIHEHQELELHPASEVILNPATIINFRDNYLKAFGVNYINFPLYQSIIEGKKFQGYEHLSPLFYNSAYGLIDYLKNPLIIYDNLSVQSILEHENNCLDLYTARVESNKIKLNTFYPALPTSQLYYTSEQIRKGLEQEENILIIPPDSAYENSAFAYPLETITAVSFIENKTVFEKLFEIIEKNNTKIPIIFCQSKSNIERFKNIISNYSKISLEIENIQSAQNNVINLIAVSLSKGFYTEKYLLLLEIF